MLLNYYSRKIKNVILITSEFKSKTNIFVKVINQDIWKHANRYTILKLVSIEFECRLD